MKKIKQKRIILALLLLLTITVSFAYYTTTDSFENIFRTSKYGTKVEEVFESPDDWRPGIETSKVITATNTGTVCENVRVKYTENWKSENGTTLPLIDPNLNEKVALINFDHTEDWKESNGYYYYKKNLLEGDTTTSFIKSVTFNPNYEGNLVCTTDPTGKIRTCTSSDDSYEGATYTLTITVETIQCSAMKDAWGLEVEDLVVKTTLDTGANVNAKMLSFAGTGKIKGIQKVTTLPAAATDANIISTSASDKPLYAWYDAATESIQWYSEAERIDMNANSSGLFKNLVDLENITGIASWNKEKVTNMSEMFMNAGSATTNFTLDLSGWDTSKVTNMSKMFAGAGGNATTWSLGSLVNWDTSQVTDMSYMFQNAGMAANINLDLGNWNTRNVTNMSHMFENFGKNSASFLLDTSNWYTNNVEDMTSMFQSTGENAPVWDLSEIKVYATKVSNMFKDCKSGKGNVEFRSNPTEYTAIFDNAATTTGSQLYVRYSSTTTSIDSMIATKSATSNIQKGNQID